MIADLAKRLPVKFPGGQYDIIVGRNLLPHACELAGIDGPTAVVTDSNVGPLYADQIKRASAVIIIPAGERHKNLATVQSIYGRLLRAGIDRQGTILALGGGVVGDIAGFAAATYMRGINFVQCPTSLLAMVDASVGGKTGVDLPQGKNLVGSFKHPLTVLADTATLETLPAVELAAGLAEVIKHGLIADPGLLERLSVQDFGREALTTNRFQSLVVDAIQVKRDIVEVDPYEQGERAVLNLGHTFGHAFEQVSDYALGHGQAVAIGLVAAANLSARLGHCAPALQSRIETLLTRVGLPICIPANLLHSSIIRAMGSDKKKAAGRVRFVLIREVGDVFVTADVPETAVYQTLASITCEERK